MIDVKRDGEAENELERHHHRHEHDGFPDRREELGVLAEQFAVVLQADEAPALGEHRERKLTQAVDDGDDGRRQRNDDQKHDNRGHAEPHEPVRQRACAAHHSLPVSGPQPLARRRIEHEDVFRQHTDSTSGPDAGFRAGPT